MANTLTALIPDVYAALDVVSRELVGFIPSVLRDAKADRVALGQTLRIPAAPSNTAGRDIAPAMSLPVAADQVIGNSPFAITKSRAFPFSWTGEERYAVDQGPGALTLSQGQIAQAMRAAVNEIELDISNATRLRGSRAYGTAGTTPFASTLGDPAQVRKILDDNGAPASDRALVINTTAGANARTLAQLTKVNEQGSEATLRQGVLLDIHGLALRESAQVQTPVVGTAAAYVLNGAHAMGATTITLKTGTGTVLAGDIVTINSDKYLVLVGTAAAGPITISAPGLQKPGADGNTVTLNAASARNTAFSRNAVVLGARLPELEEGDMASDRETVTDSLTGISFEIARYPGYRMSVYEVAIAWGVYVIKPEHVAYLLG